MDNIKKILIATPAYNSMVCSQYTESLLKTCMLLSQRNILFNVKFINNQLVTRARNMLSSIFMGNDYTHMMFIDADVVWNPDDVLKLLDWEEECVLGIYPNKAYYYRDGELNMTQSSKMVLPIKNKEDNENLIQIERAATGFMLLTKSALKRIEPDIEQFALPNGGQTVLLYNYFDCCVVDKDYLTEDYYFSYLFIKNGGTIYCDTRIKLGHVGNHEYGSLT